MLRATQVDKTMRKMENYIESGTAYSIMVTDKISIIVSASTEISKVYIL